LIFMAGIAGAAGAGAVAGLAVALPLGAIGVLLVQQAITAGWRAAAAGALGIGMIDGLYAAVAVLAGTSLSRALTGHESAVQLVGAGLLTAVAVRGLIGLRQVMRDRVPTSDPVSGTAAGVRSSPLRVLGRFFALTAINPLTAIYFVALAAGSGDAIGGPERSSAFVVGVFVASLTWQLLLVTVGAVAGSRLGERSRLVTGLVGYLVVLGYAVRMAAGGN
jgi:arginine exporter protein ArgO